MSWLVLALAVLVAPSGGGRLRAKRVTVPPRVVIGALALLLMVVVIAADRALPVLAGCIAAMTAVHLLGRIRTSQARSRERRVVAMFLGHLVADIRAGATLAHACRHAVAELDRDTTPAHLATELTTLASHVRRGGNGAELLRTSDSAELRGLGVMWSLTDTYGLPLSTLLGAMRDRMDTAARHASATQAALAGPKATATVLAILPVAGIGMGTVMGANPVGFLTSTALGGVLLLAGTVLTCAGVLASQTIMAKAADS